MRVQTIEHEGYIIEVYQDENKIVHGYVLELRQEKVLFFTKTYGIIRFHTEPIHFVKGIDSETAAINICIRSIKNRFKR